jgi:hypothetical protein
VNADLGVSATRVDEAAFHGERTDPGEEIPTVLAVGDLGLVDADLQEEIVDIGIGPAGRRDDGHLAGQRMSAADAVDLACVGRAHHT